MEDTNETIKDKVVDSIRRNKVRITYYSVGVVAGAVVTRLMADKRNHDFHKLVEQAIQTTGEYVYETPGWKTVITKTD